MHLQLQHMDNILASHMGQLPVVGPEMLPRGKALYWGFYNLPVQSLSLLSCFSVVPHCTGNSWQRVDLTAVCLVSARALL